MLSCFPIYSLLLPWQGEEKEKKETELHICTHTTLCPSKSDVVFEGCVLLVMECKGSSRTLAFKGGIGGRAERERDWERRQEKGWRGVENWSGWNCYHSPNRDCAKLFREFFKNWKKLCHPRTFYPFKIRLLCVLSYFCLWRMLFSYYLFSYWCANLISFNYLIYMSTVFTLLNGE